MSGNELYREATERTSVVFPPERSQLRYKPVEYLVISLEGRGEWATRDIYYSRSATH